MNRKHRQTLAALFSRSDNKDIRWGDFISLMEELGGEINTNGGSMTGFRLNGSYAVFHRPHPDNLIYPSILRRI